MQVSDCTSTHLESLKPQSSHPEHRRRASLGCLGQIQEQKQVSAFLAWTEPVYSTALVLPGCCFLTWTEPVYSTALVLPGCCFPPLAVQGIQEQNRARLAEAKLEHKARLQQLALSNQELLARTQADYQVRRAVSTECHFIHG